jgi:hypothetical protein
MQSLSTFYKNKLEMLTEQHDMLCQKFLHMLSENDDLLLEGIWGDDNVIKDLLKRNQSGSAAWRDNWIKSFEKLKAERAAKKATSVPPSPKTKPSAPSSPRIQVSGASSPSSQPSAPSTPRTQPSGGPSSPTSQGIKAQLTTFPTFAKPKSIPGQLAKTAGQAVRGVFTIPGAAGIGGAIGADIALDKAADVTGVETLKHGAVKTPVSWGVGAAVDTAVGHMMKHGARSLLTKAGLGAVGGGFLAGAAVGGAAYGGYKLGEYFGEKIGHAIGGGASLNEKPKGVAGGDPTLNVKNAQEEAEEEERKRRNEAEIAKQSEERNKRIADMAAKMRSGEMAND